MTFLHSISGWFRLGLAAFLILLPTVVLMVAGVHLLLLPLGIFYILGLLILMVTPLGSDASEYNI